MVVVNSAVTDSIMRMPPDEADPGPTDEDVRMRDLAEAISQMAEGEHAFHNIQSQENGGISHSGKNSLSVPTGTPRTCSRPCSLIRSVHNRSIMSHTVTFSNKNSAMSRIYSSPRQYTLSASTVKRSASGMIDRIRQRTVSNMRLRSLHSTQAFDYDEYEGKNYFFFFLSLFLPSFVQHTCILQKPHKRHDTYINVCSIVLHQHSKLQKQKQNNFYRNITMLQ